LKETHVIVGTIQAKESAKIPWRKTISGESKDRVGREKKVWYHRRTKGRIGLVGRRGC